MVVIRYSCWKRGNDYEREKREYTVYSLKPRLHSYAITPHTHDSSIVKILLHLTSINLETINCAHQLEKLLNHSQTHTLTVARSTSPSREVKSSCRLAGLLLARRSVTCWKSRVGAGRWGVCVCEDRGRGYKKGCKHRQCKHMQAKTGGTCERLSWPSDHGIAFVSEHLLGVDIVIRVTLEIAMHSPTASNAQYRGCIVHLLWIDFRHAVPSNQYVCINMLGFVKVYA